MPLDEFLLLLVASLGYGLWVRWLVKNTRAPKSLCFMAGACAAVAAVTLVSALWGLVSSFGALGAEGDSSQKAKALADGIYLMMRSLQIGKYAVFAGGLSLVALTWRYHGPKPTASKQDAR